MAEEDDTTTDDTSDEGDDGKGERTFTQADVDRIIAKRFAETKALEERVAALEPKAKQLDELEAANASELEKAQKRADEAEAALAKAEEVRAAERREAAVVAAASKAGAVDPDAVAALVLRDSPDLDEAGAKDAVEALKSDRERLFGVSNGDRSSGSADGGARDKSGSAHPYDGDMAAIMEREGLKSL